MGIVEYIIICLFVGLVVYAVQRWAPIPDQIKSLILWAAVIVLVLILLHALGLFGRDIAIPHVLGDSR